MLAIGVTSGKLRSMVRRDQPPLRLDEEVDRFEQELRHLAYAVVRSVLTAELARRRAAAPPPPRTRPPASRAQLPLPVVADPAPVAAAPAPSSVPDGKRRPWTRETVIDELAQWLLTGQVVEAAFVTRHGRPGLVAGAKRIFGRFDAALNAANLHLARKHPDGPPTTR